MGLQKMASNVTFAQGCDVKCTTTLKFNDAVNAAKNADVVVMVIGLDEGQERSGIFIMYYRKLTAFCNINEYHYSIFHFVAKVMIDLVSVCPVTKGYLFKRSNNQYPINH